MENKTFIYEGNKVTFELGDGTVMTNATEMAKPFGKRPVDWLKTDNAKSFIKALTEVKKCTSADLVIVRKGGEGDQGTWTQEDVTIEFARWLAPKFSIWCNSHIKQMLKEGTTSIGSLPEDEIIFKGYQILTKRVLALESENQQLRPKAELMDIVIDMEECLDVGQVAKALELPYGRNTLFAKLREMGIFFRNRNEPKQKYIEAGYFKLKEHVVPRNDHPEFVVLKVLVTQKGLYWLSKKLGVVAVQQKLIQIQ